METGLYEAAAGRRQIPIVRRERARFTEGDEPGVTCGKAAISKPGILTCETLHR
jgi:hypothetical protein